MTELDLDKPCEHEDFSAFVDVGRLSDVEDGPITGYTAEVMIECSNCEERFRFIGVKAGVSGKEPMCSIDEFTAHLPIRPCSSDPDFGLGIPGFAVNIRY